MGSPNAYYRYYESQLGGQLPVYRGGLQSGEGIGDILRGIFRFIAPIALRGISTFAGQTIDAHQRGASLKDAAKAALNPTLNSVVSGIGDQVRNMQSGTGLKRSYPYSITDKYAAVIKSRPTIFLNKAESLAAAAACAAPGRHQSIRKRRHQSDDEYKSRGGGGGGGKVIRLSNGRFASGGRHLNF